MEIYENSNKWEWRFGETPQFTHELEQKFDWALVDMHLDVKKGVITQAKVFSDCLMPIFIEELNEVLNTGEIKYDKDGINNL